MTCRLPACERERVPGHPYCVEHLEIERELRSRRMQDLAAAGIFRPKPAPNPQQLSDDELRLLRDCRVDAEEQAKRDTAYLAQVALGWGVLVTFVLLAMLALPWFVAGTRVVLGWYARYGKWVLGW